MRAAGELQDPFKNFERWARSHRTLLPRTIHDYGNKARQANRWLLHHFHQPLVTATPRQLQEFVASLPATASSRNNARSALLCVFEYFQYTRARKTNPAVSLQRLPQPKPAPRPQAVELVWAFIREARVYSQPFGVLAVLGFNTGLRINELRLLEWPNWSGDFIFIVQKGGQMRMVYINKACRRELLLWRRACPEGRWIFPSPRDGTRPMSSHWMWRKCKDIGVSVGIPDFHPRMFRYSIATQTWVKTHDLRKTADVLGHTGTNNVHCYIGFDSGHWEYMEDLGFDPPP